MLFGVLVFFILNMFVDMPFFILVFVILGSIFVDVDSCNSKIGRKFWFLSWCFKHRGILHSLIACLFLSLAVCFFNLWFGFGFFIGYLSHLFIDSFTIMGIRMFWPLKLRIKGRIRSGYWVEGILFSLILFLDFWFILDYLF